MKELETSVFFMNFKIRIANNQRQREKYYELIRNQIVRCKKGCSVLHGLFSLSESRGPLTSFPPRTVIFLVQCKLQPVHVRVVIRIANNQRQREKY